MPKARSAQRGRWDLQPQIWLRWWIWAWAHNLTGENAPAPQPDAYMPPTAAGGGVRRPVYRTGWSPSATVLGHSDAQEGQAAKTSAVRGPGGGLSGAAEAPQGRGAAEGKRGSSGSRDLGGLRRRPPSSLRAPVLLLPACLSVPCCLSGADPDSICAQVNGPRCARAGAGSGMRRLT